MADDSRKLFYSIGEVADIFRVNESTLRFWEKEFPTVIKPKKNAKGTRNYTKDDIENIRLVHFLLKEKGMTLAGARKKMREEKKGMTAQHELADRLKKIKSELLKLQSELGQSAQEAPEFEVEEVIAKRLVFAEPGSEMIPVAEHLQEVVLPDVLEETLPELSMDELPVPELELLPEPEPDFEESPFDFQSALSDEDEGMVEPEPEPEPTPEQNLFYEQPEPVEPPKPEPSKDGWSGTLF